MVQDPTKIARGIVGDFISDLRSDPIGALDRSADSGNRQPRTATVTPYALTLHLQRGKKRAVIGGAHEFNMQQGVTVEELWTVRNNNGSVPEDLVQQQLSTRTLTLQRYDLYRAWMEDVFGESSLVLLTDQTGSFTLRTTWRSPASPILASLPGNLVPQTRIYEFVGCHFQSFGRQASMGTSTVGTNATIVWRTLRRLT